jgi:hypothetical protein
VASKLGTADIDLVLIEKGVFSMAYDRVNTVKVARPDTEEGYMIINASDYRADLPQWMYEQGLAYDPAVWKPYVEQPVRAPRGDMSETTKAAQEKK